MEEAVQILAEQVDSLIGRVEVVEDKQVEQEKTLSGVQSIVDQQQEIINQQNDLIEQMQGEQQVNQLQITKEKACREATEILEQLKYLCGMSGFPQQMTLDECIAGRKQYYATTNRQAELDRANDMIELKPSYLDAKTRCETGE